MHWRKIKRIWHKNAMAKEKWKQIKHFFSSCHRQASVRLKTSFKCLRALLFCKTALWLSWREWLVNSRKIPSEIPQISTALFSSIRWKWWWSSRCLCSFYLSANITNNPSSSSEISQISQMHQILPDDVSFQLHHEYTCWTGCRPRNIFKDGF